MKDKWKLREDTVCFFSRCGSIMYKGGNHIVCGRATRALLRQTNCDFIPAQYTLKSSFKLLMSVPTTTVIRHSIQGHSDPALKSKARYWTLSIQWWPHILLELYLHRAFVCGWTGDSACTVQVKQFSCSQHFCFEKTETSGGFIIVKMEDIQSSRKDKMNAESHVF